MQCSSSFRPVIARGVGRAARRDSLAILVFVCALAHGTAGCGWRGNEQPQEQRPPTEVTVVTATSNDVPVTWEFIAQVQSSRQVNIQARVNGFLDKRVYTEGAVVKEGDVLFLMDQKPFQAQLDAAAAALKGEEARLEVARANLARIKPLAAAECAVPERSRRCHRRIPRPHRRPSSRPRPTSKRRSSTCPTPRSPRR